MNTKKRKLMHLLGAGILLCNSVYLVACGDGDAGIQSETSPAAAEAVSQQSTAGEEQKPFDAAAVKSIVPSQKEELVSVTATADGTPKKIEVSGTLYGYEKESEYVRDISNLIDLKNSRGEEEWVQTEDGTIYWQNLGEDIHFEGTSEAPLPIDLRVTYSLDGKEMPLEKLKGKSGTVKIRFDYTNNTDAPFLAVSMAALPEEVFSDVKISKGRVMMLGGQKMAVGYALPGLEEKLELNKIKEMEDAEIPSYVEITAFAEDFSLDFTATLFSSGLFREMDEEKLDRFDERIADMDDLEEAVGEMEDAAKELADGTKELRDGASQYINGVNEVANAIGQINSSLAGQDLSGLTTLENSLKQVSELSQLSDPLKKASEAAKLADSLQQISALSALADPLEAAAGYANLAEPVRQLSNLAELADQLEALAQTMPDSAELQALAAWAPALRQMAGLSGQADTLSQAAALSEGVEPLRQLSALSEGAEALSQLSSLSEAADALSQLSALSGAASSLSDLQSGLQELKNGVGQLHQGASQLPAAGAALTEGLSSLYEGTEEFKDGIVKFNEEGIKELAKLFKEDLGGLVKRIRNLKQADLAYRGYTPSYPEQAVSTSFLIETAGTD